MTDATQQHELVNDICTHCGAKAPWEAVTCVPRKSGKPHALQPEPARRVMAADDESIAGRIAELRAERDAAMNETTIEEQTG